MFEVGFTEILLIMVIALVVLGPERLPKLAADVGRWMGRARSMARQLRSQLDQEVHLEEMLREPAKGTAATNSTSSAAGTTGATGGVAAAAGVAGAAGTTATDPPPAPGTAAGYGPVDFPEVGAPTDEPHSHGPDHGASTTAGGVSPPDAQAVPAVPDYGLEAHDDPSLVTMPTAAVPPSVAPPACAAPPAAPTPAPAPAPALDDGR